MEIDVEQTVKIYLYIICKMKIYSIFTYLDLFNYFTGTESKKNTIGYLFTTIYGMVEYILNIKSKEDLKWKSKL